MAAVGTFAPVGMEGRVGNDGSVIFFFLGCGFVSDSRLHLLFRVIAAHDGTDCRSGQGIVNALDGSQAYAEGGTFFIKETATGKAFHHRDSHIVLLTDFVETCPVRIDTF